MKRILAIVALVLSVFIFTSCGEAGSTTLTVNLNDPANQNYYWIDGNHPFGGLPSVWYVGTTYDIVPGSYDGAFVTGWVTGYSSGGTTYVYDLYIDDYLGTWHGVYPVAVPLADAEYDYWYGGLDGAGTLHTANYDEYFFLASYDIDPYYGMFPGMTGSQRDYTLVLASDGYIGPTSNNIAAAKSLATGPAARSSGGVVVSLGAKGSGPQPAKTR